MSSNPCNYADYEGGETIKRQEGVMYGCMAAGQSPSAQAWTAAYAGFVCVYGATAAAVCASWRYIRSVRFAFWGMWHQLMVGSQAVGHLPFHR